MLQYLKEVKAEIKKVTWPSTKEALKGTGVVLLFSLILGAYLGVVDFIINKALSFLINL